MITFVDSFQSYLYFLNYKFMHTSWLHTYMNYSVMYYILLQKRIALLATTNVNSGWWCVYNCVGDFPTLDVMSLGNIHLIFLYHLSPFIILWGCKQTMCSHEICPLSQNVNLMQKEINILECRPLGWISPTLIQTHGVCLSLCTLEGLMCANKTSKLLTQMLSR